MIDHKVELGEDYKRVDGLGIRPRAEVRDAIAGGRRAGEGWAIGSAPGPTLHGALCRACGIGPRDHGSIGYMATAVGLSRQAYQRIVDRGGLKSAAELAAQVGYYLVVLPGRDGPRYICGDRPMQLL